MLPEYSKDPNARHVIIPESSEYQNIIIQYSYGQGRTECGAPGALAPGAIIRGRKIIEKLFLSFFTNKICKR